MKLTACLLVLFASSLLSPGAHAQGKTDYTLNEGQVHFHVPASWTAIMEKSEGNPQAIAFQVPDPTAQGSDDSATATVKTRQLKSAADFASTVAREFEFAKGQGGYETDASNRNKAVHQYFVVRGKTRYLARDSFSQIGMIAVEVHCLRPLLAATAPAWNLDFDSACDGVVASLKQ